MRERGKERDRGGKGGERGREGQRGEKGRECKRGMDGGREVGREEWQARCYTPVLTGCVLYDDSGHVGLDGDIHSISGDIDNNSLLLFHHIICHCYYSEVVSRCR